MIEAHPADEPPEGQPLDEDAVHQQRHAVRPGGQLGGVVVGDEAADRDAGEVVQQRQHRVEHRPADVLKVDVDALRTGGFQALGQVGLAVVEAGVEAEFLLDEAALLLAPGDADDATAL